MFKKRRRKYIKTLNDWKLINKLKYKMRKLLKLSVLTKVQL